MLLAGVIHHIARTSKEKPRDKKRVRYKDKPNRIFLNQRQVFNGFNTKHHKQKFHIFLQFTRILVLITFELHSTISCRVSFQFSTFTKSHTDKIGQKNIIRPNRFESKLKTQKHTYTNEIQNSHHIQSKQSIQIQNHFPISRVCVLRSLTHINHLSFFSYPLSFHIIKTHKLITQLHHHHSHINRLHRELSVCVLKNLEEKIRETASA